MAEQSDLFEAENGGVLRRVRLENFKCFQSVEVECSPFSVLMGENGCGKTSLLQAISLGLRLLTTTNLLQWDSQRRELKFRRSGIAFQQLPGLPLEDPTDLFYGRRSRGGRGGGTTPIRIELVDAADNTYRLEITSQFGALNVKCTSSRSDIPHEPMLLGSPPLLVSGFVGIPGSEERLFPVAIEDRLTRGRVSDILRNLLLDVRSADEGRYERLCEVIRDNFSFHVEAVDFDENSDRFVHAMYLERLPGLNLNLDLASAGSGFLQILQILTPIYRAPEQTSVVLLDEPDAHLHPNLQRTVARVLQQVGEFEGLQILLSTHSTPIIREVAPDSVIPVTSGKQKLAALNAPQDVEAEIEARVDNFIVGKASIAGRLLFVEDGDLKVFRRIDSLHRLGIFEGPRTPPCVSTSGKDDKVPFRIGPVIEAIAGRSVEVSFVRDGDGLPASWRTKLQEFANSAGVNLLLLPVHEIESCLLCPALIQRALAKRGVETELPQVEEILVDTLKDVVMQARYRFETVLRDNIYKTGRLVNDQFSFGDAEKEAARVRLGYESLLSLEELRRVGPGKEALREVLRRLEERFGCRVTKSFLVRQLKSEDIPSEVVACLQSVTNPSLPS